MNVNKFMDMLDANKSAIWKCAVALGRSPQTLYYRVEKEGRWPFEDAWDLKKQFDLSDDTFTAIWGDETWMPAYRQAVDNKPEL